MCWDTARIGSTADIQRERNKEKHLKRTSQSISAFIRSTFHKNEILGDNSIPILPPEKKPDYIWDFPVRAFSTNFF